MKSACKNIGLVFAGFLFAAAAIELACWSYVKLHNIQAPSYLYENRIDMLAPDPLIGYVNKPDFSAYCFGNIHVRTNERGFRGVRPVAVSKKPGVTRIVGIGDSVMWGVGVRLEDSIMGWLERKLGRDRACEVIDAGVIGYSTYQELLFFEKYIEPLKPDIVMVNFCANDILSSEDPYSNLVEVTRRYLESPALADGSLTQDEKQRLEKLRTLFKAGENPFYQTESSEELQKLLGEADNAEFEASTDPAFIKFFITLPAKRLAEKCRLKNIRLIYLFIPPVMELDLYKLESESLKEALHAAGCEYIDLQPIKQQNRLISAKSNKSLSFLTSLLPRDVVLVLDDLIKRRVHRQDIYLDWVHPTARGNEIIAEHIHRYLSKDESTPGR